MVMVTSYKYRLDKGRSRKDVTMQVTRRQFLQYCTAAAGALGLTGLQLRELEAALADTGAPTLIWLHGSGCQGDSVSFLNLFADLEPVGHVTTASVLIEHVNLAYHTVVMASAGQTAVDMAMQAHRKGGYVLVLEGGVPTAFEGRACSIMTVGDQEITYQQAIQMLADNAAAVVCVGTCASYGGIPKAPPNPTGVISGSEALPDKTVINIPGCPAHPDWVAWAVVQLILGQVPELDRYNRPTALYGDRFGLDPLAMNVHENCPRNPINTGNQRATTFGQDHLCLEDLGCRGPETYSDCPMRKWNNGENGPANWCVDSNGLCFGCVEPDFPGGDFYAK